MSKKHPHLLLLTSDQHAPRVCGYAGDPWVRTPNLDRLAAGGVVFNNHYAANPVCQPGRNAMCTGQLPREIGTPYFMDILPLETPTYMRHFSQHGYMTTCVGKMHFHGPEQMYGWRFRPYGDMEICQPRAIPGYTPERDVTGGKPPRRFNYGDHGGYNPHMLKTAGSGERHFMLFDQAVTEAAAANLHNYFRMTIDELYSEERPLLCQVSYKTPHCPFVAPEELFCYYRNLVEMPSQEMPENLPPYLRAKHAADQPDDITEEIILDARAGYWALVEWMDRQLGVVLQALDELGVRDEFLIMYTSDHGEMAGEKGLWQKTCFYEQAVRCPMILAGPGLPRGATVQHNTSHIDLFPTLADMAGLPAPSGVRGQSMLPLIGAGNADDRVVVSERFGPKQTAPTPGQAQNNIFMAKWRSFKYCDYGDDICQLFDLATDPDELTDLSNSPDHQDILERLRGELAALPEPWRAEDPTWRMTARPAPPTEKSAIKSSLGREREALRQWLGHRFPATYLPAPFLTDRLEILERLETAILETAASDDRLDALDHPAHCGEYENLVRATAASLANALRNQAFDRAGRAIFRAADFGARGDGLADDGPALRRALAAAAAAGQGAVCELDAGCYRIGALEDETLSVHLLLRGAKDILIRGAGRDRTMIVGTRIGGMLALHDCANIQVRDIGFDYAPLPFTQGRITAVDPAAGTMDWELETGFSSPLDYPFSVAEFWGGSVRARHDGRLVPGGRGKVTLRADLGNGQFRLSVEKRRGQEECLGAKVFRTGAPLVLHTRGVKGARQALWLSNCRCCGLRAVAVRSAYDYACLISDSVETVLEDCALDAPPGSGRLSAFNCDGYHLKSNRSGPYLHRCRAARTMDDTVNIYSRGTSVLEQIDARRVVLCVQAAAKLAATPAAFTRGPDARNFQPGDLLSFMDPTTGETAIQARIDKVGVAEWQGQTFLEIALDRDLPPLKSRAGLGKTDAQVTTQEYLYDYRQGEIEHFAVNLNTKSDGFVIRACTFERASVAGIKLKASNGLVVDNRFADFGWAAIDLTHRLMWQEFYAPRNVLIASNIFDADNAISASCDYPNRPGIGPPYIARVEIVGNTMNSVSGAGVWLSNARRCNVRSNQLLIESATGKHPPLWQNPNCGENDVDF